MKAFLQSKSRKFILILLFWIAVWQGLSILIDSKLLIASPLQTMQALFALVQTSSFWSSIIFSTLRIGLGFLLGLMAGILLGIVCSFVPLMKALLLPVFSLIKAVPVVSFVVLALLWIKSRNLSVLISFLMVLPIIFIGTLQGISSTDTKLLEMAQVFRMSRRKKARYIYLPSLLLHLSSSVSISLGFCFKSGIAAEVISLPKGSIGEKLYEAKLYLQTGDLFAWTVVIVLLSLFFEKLVRFLVFHFFSPKKELRPDASIQQDMPSL